MSQELIVLLNGDVVGTLFQERAGRLRFVYESSWRENSNAYPLSLSLPLALSEHSEPAVRTYLGGLLSDNDRILEDWGRQFGVSPRNPFAILTHIGEDCAGAVQFALPKRVSALQSSRASKVEWLSEADIAERLRGLKGNHLAGRAPEDAGYFSLPGAQPKTTLFYENGRWGIPSGRTPTTHILKPPVVHYKGFAENEHMLLSLARAIGLPAAHTEVRHFDDQLAIVVERYDRLRTEQGVQRIHQEDFCQALAISSSIKYENEGGPGIPQIVQVLREYSTRADIDVNTFLDAIAFNWVTGGTDAHAKNYSVLIAGRGQVRLALLYDIVSALPYPELNTPKLTLAMKLGGEYRAASIGLRHWERLATQLSMSGETLVARAREIAHAILDQLPAVRRAAEAEGLNRSFLRQLEQSITPNAVRCAKILGG